MERATTGLSCPEEIFKAYSGLVANWGSMRESVKGLYSLSLSFVDSTFRKWLVDDATTGEEINPILDAIRKTKYRDFILNPDDFWKWYENENSDWRVTGDFSLGSYRFPEFEMRDIKKLSSSTLYVIKPPRWDKNGMYLKNSDYEKKLRKMCNEFCEKVNRTYFEKFFGDKGNSGPIYYTYYRGGEKLFWSL